MPRATELKSEEAAVSSPLRRSCRIVAVHSPHPIKGRRLSATSENNGADEKNENKPSRAKRAASVTKEDTDPKIEPAKPRTRRSSATTEPVVVEEEKKEPVTRSRRSSVTEEPSQETLKPVRTRRRSITDDASKTPADGKSTEGDPGKSKTVTRRRSISKEPSDEIEETRPATRSRRKSVDKDIDVEILEKKPTRQRRASTEKLEEPETKLVKLTPVKTKRRPSVTDNVVVLEPIEEVETERKSLSPSPVDDTSSEHNADSCKRKHEPTKADLDLSIINECSFTEGNSSRSEGPISNSEMTAEPLKESYLESKTRTGEDEIEENAAAPSDSPTPPEEAKNVTTPKKSPRFRTSTDSETATDGIGTKAQNNTEDIKSSPELRDDVQKEAPSEPVLNKSQTSKIITPEKMSKPIADIETAKSLDKPKQTSPETTVSPRKSPRILARKETGGDQKEKDFNITMETLKETKTSTNEQIQSPTPDKEKLKSLHQNVVDTKDSDLKSSPQQELNVEDDSAFLPKASESEGTQKKESTTHISTGSEDSFRFHLSDSRLDSSPGGTEEDDVLNVSKISNSSDKENMEVNIDIDSIKSKAPITVEKRVLGDLSALNEKLTDLKRTTAAARVSNVFRPKNLEFSFVEPMDVDRTSVDLESTTSEKLDRKNFLSGALDDSVEESFHLNLSMTPVDSPINSEVFEISKKVIDAPKKVTDTPEKVTDTPEKVIDTPKEVTDTHKKVINTPEKVTDTLKKVTGIPKKVANTPEDVAGTPIEVTDTLKKVIDTPEKVTDTPKNVTGTPKEVTDTFKKIADTPKEVIDTPKIVTSVLKNVADTQKKVIEIDEDKLDVSSEKVIPESNTLEPDELIVDISEASCATPAVESEDASSMSISEEPILEMKEESLEQIIPDTTNMNMSTVLEEAVDKPDEQNASKTVEDQSGGEKTIVSPDYDFQLPSDESSSEVDNKLCERPQSPSKDKSRASNVEKGNKDSVNADKEPEPSDEEICGKPPTEQPEQSLTTVKLIESEKICDVEKEKTEMEETAKTPYQASSATEIKDIVEADEAETVTNREPAETSEEASSLEKSLSEGTEKNIEQTHEKSNVTDDIKMEHAEGEIQSIPEEDNSTINNTVVEKKEVGYVTNVALENVYENGSHTKTDSEGMSDNKNPQIDGQDKKTTEEKDEASETRSDDLETEKTLDGDTLPEMTSINTATDLPTGQSHDVPLGGIESMKTNDELVPTTEVPTEKNDESSRYSINSIVDNDGGTILDAESVIVKIYSPTNKDDDYEEMERSFQDIVQDDMVKDEQKSKSPLSQPTSVGKKSKKARKSKGAGSDDIKSDIDEKLVEQHSVGTNSPQKIKKGKSSIDNSESNTEDSVLGAGSSRTRKKAKKNTKNDATADKTEENAPSNVDNASDKELLDQHAFEFKLSQDKKKFDRIDTADVPSSSGETDTNIDAKSTEDSCTKTPKKTKKRAKVRTLTDGSTGEVESTSNFSKRNAKIKRSELSGKHDDKNIEAAEEPTTKKKKKKNKQSRLENPKNTTETAHEKNPLEGFSLPKLDEIIDKMVLETKRTEEEDSSEEEYASEEEQEETGGENPYVDYMAEEGEEDTPSEGSNDLIDEGESINTTESERETDEDFDDDDSFICDEEVIDLISGDEEYDLVDEKSKKRKKSRIINIEDCNSDVIRIERKKKPVEPKKRTRIISVSSSSEDEKEEWPKDVVQVLDEPTAELEDEKPSEKPRKRKSSITIIENINVNDIKDTVLSERIHHLVDSFCTTMPRQGDISMNLSLEYADKDEEPSTETNEPKSLLETSPKKTKTKKRRDSKKRGSFGDETEVPTKKSKLSVSLGDVEDLQETREKSNKRKRLSQSLESINIKKGKKKKSAKKIKKSEEDPEVSNKNRRYLEDDLRSKTFGLMNQLITDIRNRPRRGELKPSTSKVQSSIDDSWDVEVVTVTPSTSIVSKSEIETYKFNKMHPKDFRSQMLYGSNRVKRIETKTLLKKKGAYS